MALVYAEHRLIEPRPTGARLSALVQAALVYSVYGSRLYGMTPILWLNPDSVESISTNTLNCVPLTHFIAFRMKPKIAAY